MKWFKHMTGLRNDEAVARYMDAAGLEGFGFLCMVMEMVAETMGPGDQRCELSLSLRRWSSTTGIHRNKILAYAEKLGSTGLATVSREGTELRVQITKLAEWRDEYSRKSGHAQEDIRITSAQIREEKDQRRERERERGEGVGRGENVFTNGVGMPREEDLPAHLRETADWSPIGAISARRR